MFQNFHNKTERNRFTRMCIGEAIISLMQTTDFSQIRVSAIVRKAGVSRMTYYHYYKDKTDALIDYLNEVIALYIQETSERPEIGAFRDYSHILFSLEFFDRYSVFFLTLARAGFHSIIINAMNDFMSNQFPPSYHVSIYERYVYAGALFNIFLKWEEDNKRKSAEEVAHIIQKVFGGR